MKRQQWEVADLIRVAGHDFIEQNRHWLTAQHLKMLRAIESCRTIALGGHLDECPHCGYQTSSFNSCRERLRLAEPEQAGPLDPITPMCRAALPPQ
jgi:hypothetical protein